MTLSSDKNDAVIEEYRRVPWSCPVMWALLCHVQPCVQQQCLLIYQQREKEGNKLSVASPDDLSHLNGLKNRHPEMAFFKSFQQNLPTVNISSLLDSVTSRVDDLATAVSDATYAVSDQLTEQVTTIINKVDDGENNGQELPQHRKEEARPATPDQRQPIRGKNEAESAPNQPEWEWRDGCWRVKRTEAELEEEGKRKNEEKEQQEKKEQRRRERREKQLEKEAKAQKDKEESQDGEQEEDALEKTDCGQNRKGSDGGDNSIDQKEDNDCEELPRPQQKKQKEDGEEEKEGVLSDSEEEKGPEDAAPQNKTSAWSNKSKQSTEQGGYSSEASSGRAANSIQRIKKNSSLGEPRPPPYQDEGSGGDGSGPHLPTAYEPEPFAKYGTLDVAFEYDSGEQWLAVTVTAATDIPALKQTGNIAWQVHLVLLPTKKQRAKTGVQKGPCPIFTETFKFSRVEQEALGDYAHQEDEKEKVLGEKVFYLTKLNLQGKIALPVTLEQGSELTRARSAGALSYRSTEDSSLPELLLGLLYNSATGQLSAEVVQGSHFKTPASEKPVNTYVKLTMLDSKGKEMSKCKTAVCRGQPNPTYKETFLFQVALFQLSEVSLVLSVFCRRSSMRPRERLGCVSLGLNSTSEDQQAHWTEMKEAEGSRSATGTH
ncbi:hypothetical protein F7725_019778 [Dissostichus mawsoni]|uniref:C2 domain-containing protein n=1 Tax=Dissostichus mawsoni TaxID=36200 RepID=A0A7J5YMS3_DISMA|nr:hypothetical protein F7725_019778 [Dissostichus mawsoni]